MGIHCNCSKKIQQIKSLNHFIDFLIKELNDNSIKGSNINDFEHQIDEIEKFYKEHYFKFNEEERRQLQLSFWAFFSKLLIDKLGEKLQLAPKSDYCAGTPQLIDFGNRVDKKGKKFDGN